MADSHVARLRRSTSTGSLGSLRGGGVGDRDLSSGAVQLPLSRQPRPAGNSGSRNSLAGGGIGTSSSFDNLAGMGMGMGMGMVNMNVAVDGVGLTPPSAGMGIGAAMESMAHSIGGAGSSSGKMQQVGERQGGRQRK